MDSNHLLAHIVTSIIQVIVVISLFCINARMKTEERNLQDDVIVNVVDLLHDKSEFYHTHSKRVGLIAGAICDAMNLDNKEKEKIRMGAMVHDIGKIYVDQEWLERNGPLTEKEWEMIKMHPIKGANLLRKLRVDSDIITGVLYHHENIDGTGYPLQLEKNNIPLAARIIRVADSIEAMASKRPYRAVKTFTEIEQELLKGKGTQFDEQIVKICLNGLSKRIKLILLNYS